MANNTAPAASLVEDVKAADEAAGMHPVLADILLEEEPDTLCWVKA